MTPTPEAMNIRTKAILSVMLIITTLTVAFLYLSIRQQNTHLQRTIATKRANAQFLAQNLQEQIFAGYKARIVSLATTKQEVVAAFARRDREALYQATLPFYQTIQKENPFFSIMHFHLPDNTSFLRMHLPEIYDDPLGEVRPIVREVNRTHKQLSGYEVGKLGLFFRVVQPVFFQDEYIGALEFGISHEQLLHLLRLRVSPEIALAVNTTEWEKASLIAAPQKTRSAYTLISAQSALFRLLPEAISSGRATESRLSVGDREYILFSDINLLSFRQEPIAMVLVAMDITEELAGTHRLIFRVVLLSLLLLLLSGTVLYFSFGQLLKRIVDLNSSLSRSNENLATAMAYVENILASMSDGLLVTRADGTITRTNAAFCQLLGYAEAELRGKKLFAFFAEPTALEEHFAGCQANGCRIDKTERELLTRAGLRVPVLFSASALVDPDGALIGIVCIVTDITSRKEAESALRQANELLEQRVTERTRELAESNTALTREMAERKRAEAQLRQAQKMRAIGTLAGGIAHDFNNILTAILGYTQLARDRVTADAICRNHLNAVFTAGQRARELVHQILTFSRQSEQEKKPIEIQLIVKEALKLLRASLPANIEMEQNISPGCGAVLADPTQIHQVVMNLCTNAYQAMQEQGGTLTVSLALAPAENLPPALPPGDYLQLVVQDTGCGMDAATLERIFEPYFTTKEAGKGTGLGLAVTHGIVASHGGHIEVGSSEGRGSTFTVYLPLHQALPAAPEATEETAEVRGGNERILVVDDEKEIVQLLELFLQGYGYQVIGQVDSVAAYEWFCTNPHEVDLVITDMSMPHLGGRELASKMLAVRPDLPIILCSGFSDVFDEEGIKQLGIRSFFLKPFREKEVVARRVRELLDARRPAAGNPPA